MLNNQFLSIIDNHSYIDWQDTFTEYCISKQFDSELCGFTVYRRMGVLFLTLFVYDHFALKATEIYVLFEFISVLTFTIFNSLLISWTFFNLDLNNKSGSEIYMVMNNVSESLLSLSELTFNHWLKWQ